jgi:hypothetical protein
VLTPDASGAIVPRRLRCQRLVGAPFRTPEDVVGGLGAVQAQSFGPAKWALGRRAQRATDAQLDRAFDAGAILRTHVLRPTWHFVLPADIRWLLKATAPRVQARSAYRHRQLGLDAATLGRSEVVLAGALRGGNQLTRREAAGVLAGAGVGVDGQRLPYILMNAELNALICSGPLQGRQHTLVLLEERAPQARELPRDEALAELARRYFTSHGPATAKDFAAWASLTLAEVATALEAVGAELRHEVIEGLSFWSSDALPAPALATPRVHLLQCYDEYLMGYTETKHVLAPPGADWAPASRPVFDLVVLLDGRVAGFWKRTVNKDRVVIEVELGRPFDGAQTEALAAEAARYGRFLGREATLQVRGGVAPVQAARRGVDHGR